MKVAIAIVKEVCNPDDLKITYCTDVRRVEFNDGSILTLTADDPDAGVKELLFDLAMMMPDRVQKKFERATDRAWFNLKGPAR